MGQQQFGAGVTPVEFVAPAPVGLTVETIVFTEAQLKAALTGAGTRIQLKAAAGANKIYEFVQLTYSVNWTAAPAGTVNLTVMIGAFASAFFTLTNWYQGAVTGRRSGILSPTSFNLTPAQTTQIANVAVSLQADAAIPGGATLSAGGFKVDLVYRVHSLV